MPALEPLRSSLLDGLPGISHGFFTRRGGVSEGIYQSLNIGVGSNDQTAHVLENRRRVAAAFDQPETGLLTCRQVHSALVHTLDAPAPSRPQGDGLATRTRGLVLGALHADCAPLLLVDPEAQVVAAVHAGWKGALAGVAEAGVAAMERLGASRRRIRVAIGPCIGPSSYEVGLDFLETFQARDPKALVFFREGRSPEKRLFDLPAYLLARLGGAGVETAAWIGRDTLAEEDDFFSHRRAVLRSEADYGRLISAIALV